MHYEMKQKQAKHHSKKGKDDHDKMEQSVKSLSLRQIRQSYATAPARGLHHTPDQLICKLTAQLRQKLTVDLHARSALEAWEQPKLQRLSKIESEITELNQQNALKLRALSQLEQTFLKRVESQVKRDAQEERRLLSEYKKLQTERNALQLTRAVKKIKEQQDWLALEEQQHRLQLLARSYTERQLAIAKDRTVQQKPTRIKEDEQHHKKEVEVGKVKRERRKKNAEELKEMGRQFLEHAKKVQAEKLKAGTKILDVYKKSIDYLPELRSLLQQNAQDLSKPLQSVTPAKKKQRNPKPT